MQKGLKWTLRAGSLREKSLQIRQRVLNIYKQRRKIDDTLGGVYNGSMAFSKIMNGWRKIAPKYLSLEQLRNWWQDVYVPLDDGSIFEHQLGDVATYLVVIDKYLTYKVDWDRSVKWSREGIVSIENWLRVFPFPLVAGLDEMLLKVHEGLDWIREGQDS